MAELMRLWHGTSAESAQRLLKDGWMPNSAPAGSQCGNPALLYLTNEPENARWYADQKEFGIVLEILVETADLRVDPEDGVGETITEELRLSATSGLPANLALFRPVSGARIGIYAPEADDEPEPDPRSL